MSLPDNPSAATKAANPHLWPAASPKPVAASDRVETPKEAKAAKLAGVVSELQIQDECERWLRAHGPPCEYLWQPKKRKTSAKPGWPDVVIFFQGPRVLFVEFKRPDVLDVSPDQATCHARLAALDWPVAIIRSTAEFVSMIKDFAPI